MNEDTVGPMPGSNGDGNGEIRDVADGVFAHEEPPALSPSLWKDREAPAFELKFNLDPVLARAVAAWAADHLQLDPHADPARDHSYLVHGLYFDTPTFDVYHRSPGYKKRKFRLRRYGDNQLIFLEQKRKSDGKVAKRRVQVTEAEIERLREVSTEIDWSGRWFHRRITKRLLQPSCLISYERQAFFGQNVEGPLRLTLDRNVRGKLAEDWNVAPVLNGSLLTPERVLLELKYRKHLPTLFRTMMEDFALTPGPLSKYRLAIEATGKAPANGRLADVG